MDFAHSLLDVFLSQARKGLFKVPQAGNRDGCFCVNLKVCDVEMLNRRQDGGALELKELALL